MEPLAALVGTQLQALRGVATAAPKVLGKAANAAIDALPTVVASVRPKPAISAVAQLGSSLVRGTPLSLFEVTRSAPFESASRGLNDAARAGLSVCASSGVEGTNDILAAVGLPVRIVGPSCPDTYVRVQVLCGNPGALTGDEPTGEPDTVQKLVTPKEFVKFMRVAKTEDGAGGNRVQVYVERLAAEGRLQSVPLLPEIFQRKLYVDIASLIIFTAQRALLKLHNASVWGHTLEVKFERQLTSCGDRFNVVGNQQLSAFVDKLLADKAVHMPFVPSYLEKKLYLNCITVMFHLLSDLLTGQDNQITVLGHAVHFQLKPQQLTHVLHELLDNKPVKHCAINEAVLEELVNELLADAEINLSWMPDALESKMYMSVMRLLIRIAEHVITRLRFNVLGREVRMSILSHIEAKAAKAGKEAKAVDRNDGSMDGSMYYEEEEPLKTMSTTELEERLKDLNEQRRLLEALQQLHGADFDLTADTPMVQKGAGGIDISSAPTEAGAAQTSGHGNVEADEVHEFHQLAHTLKLARSLSAKCEVEASVDVPYSIIADLTCYPSWMPWCTSGRVLTDDKGTKSADSEVGTTGPGDSVYFGEVGFGFETGTFLGTVGDTVHYQVTSTAPVQDASDSNAIVKGRVVADAVKGFTYAERLVYDWRFSKISPTRTLIQLDMLFQARSVLYMPLWDSMQHMVLNKLLNAFVSRAEALQKQKRSAV